MRLRYALVLFFLLLPSPGWPQVPGGPSTPGVGFSPRMAYNHSYTSSGVTFANLGVACGGGSTSPAPPNCAPQISGSLIYCKDCTNTTTCGGGGGGAWAIRGAGTTWGCNVNGVNQASVSGVLGNLTAGPGAISITGNSGNGTDQINNISVNGLINVKAYGATGNGVTDDSASINSAASAARSANVGLYFPAGTYLASANDLNFSSNTAQSFAIIGDSASTTSILCEHLNGNCVDATGSDRYLIKNISLNGGTSGANAPKTVLLSARSNGAATGFGFTLEHVWISTFGAYGYYNYGGEVDQCIDCRVNNAVTSGVVLSASNHAGITSAYQTLASAPTSESVITFHGGNLNINSGSCGVTFDNFTAGPAVSIHDIAFYNTFFGEAAGGGTGLCDTGGSGAVVEHLSIFGGRFEPSDTSAYKFIDFTHSYVDSLDIRNLEFATNKVSGDTLSALNFGAVDSSFFDVVVVGTGEATGVPVVAGTNGRDDFFHSIAPSQVSTALTNSNTLTNGSGNIFTWSDATPNGHVDVGGIENLPAQATLNGTTAGTVVSSEPSHAPGFHTVLLFFNGYQNSTGAAQTITYPVAFFNGPTSYGGCTGLGSTTSTVATLATSMGSPFTGQCIISGN